MKFIKVKDNIESSMPHTREDCIVFSQKWINTFLNEDDNRIQFYRLLLMNNYTYYRGNIQINLKLYMKIIGINTNTRIT